MHRVRLAGRASLELLACWKDVTVSQPIAIILTPSTVANLPWTILHVPARTVFDRSALAFLERMVKMENGGRRGDGGVVQ